MNKSELKQGLSNFLEYYANKKRSEYDYSIKKNELENEYNKFGSNLLGKWLEKRELTVACKMGNMKKFSFKDVKQLFYELNDEMSVDGDIITKERIVEGIKKEVPKEAIEFMNFKICEEEIEKSSDEINYIKYKNHKFFKKVKNVFSLLIWSIIIFLIIPLVIAILGMTDMITSVNPIFISIGLAGLTMVTVTIIRVAFTLNASNKKIDYFVNRSINEYNQVYIKIKNYVDEKIISPYIEGKLHEEYEEELSKLEKSYQDEVKVIQNKYNQCLVKLPYEIEVMYNKLDREEQDLFVTLAGNADSEKDFSNIYVQCLNAKNSRRIYEEQKMQTAEARKQTWLAEQNAKEYEKQTRLIERQAEEQRAHMAEVERQNAELVKKQNEANKLAKENAEKQLDALNRSKDILYDMDYRERNK